MRIKLFLIIMSALLLMAGCGKGVFEVQNKSYELKIVVDGILIAGEPISKIYISRNFRLDADINNLNPYPDPSLTSVMITDLESNLKVDLHYNETEKFWHDPDAKMIVAHDKTYRLDVSAVIEGRMLSASSETTVPAEGFKINSVNYNVLAYHQENEEGSQERFSIRFQRSPGTAFYHAAIRSTSPSLAGYIWDNPYAKRDTVDVLGEIYNLALQHDWILYPSIFFEEAEMRLPWDRFNFLGDYEIKVYAADNNYMDFFLSFNGVQELDGNFHEAVFHFEGDAIGVFGSMIADSVRVRVIR